MRASKTPQECHSRKKVLAAFSAASLLFLFVTSESPAASDTALASPTSAAVSVAAPLPLPLPLSLLKHRLPQSDDAPPPAPRPVALKTSRSAPRPQLTPAHAAQPPRKSAPVRSHSTIAPRRYAPPPRIPNRIPTGNIQAYARVLVGSDAQFTCLAHIIERESGWNPHAANPEGAYGIPQALPGAKMSSAGSDWRDNPETQIRWMLSYIANRYGTPCNAWNFWQGHSWY